MEEKNTKTIRKNDFVEIEFTGKANDEVFDTTDKDEAKDRGINVDVKPLIVCVGGEMLLKGFDDALDKKEIGREYQIHLTPEEAFGKRDPKLIQTLPLKAFLERDLNPVPGMTVQLDHNIAKILSVSGGRVIVDFNNPLAGKEIDYNFRINKKIEGINEKINSLQDYFFRSRFEFEIDKEKKKITFKKPELEPLLGVIGDKFKSMTGFEFEVKKEIEKKKDKNK
jgi:FKBP-type peptidyl-prolyl cis-trans isomerase 2